MKKKILFIASAIPFIVTSVSMFFMKEIIPMHYDINGKIDRFGSKYELFILPAEILAVALIWIVITKLYEIKGKSSAEKIKNNVNIIYTVGIITVSFLAALQCAIICLTLLHEAKRSFPIIDFVGIITSCFIGLLFILLGNLMPKVKMNCVFGLRVSWSMKNDRAWYVANRIAGITFVICGIISILCGFIFNGIISLYLISAITVFATIISLVVSYIKVKKL